MAAHVKQLEAAVGKLALAVKVGDPESAAEKQLATFFGKNETAVHESSASNGGEVGKALDAMSRAGMSFTRLSTEEMAASLREDAAKAKLGRQVLAKHESEDAALQSLVTALGSEEGRAELKSLFATLDKDGDGKVTSKEWGK